MSLWWAKLLLVVPAALGSDSSSTNGSVLEPNHSLLVAQSSMKLLATEVAFLGDSAGEVPGGILKEFCHRDNAYLLAAQRAPLYCKHKKDNTLTVFRTFDLAISAGWYKKEGMGYLPSNIRGLHRVDNTLWMGSDGVGVLTLDMATGLWGRYDVKETPTPGHHMGVVWADGDYSFVTFGWHREIADLDAGLHVYSHSRNCWLKVNAVPTRLVVSLGYEDGMASAPPDDRIYASEEFIPPKFRQFNRIDDNTYQLRTVYSNDSVTEIRVPVDLLDTAFAENCNERSATALHASSIATCM